jgi:hypothetical protein
MSEMRELMDTELDAVCGAHHHGHHGHGGGGGGGGGLLSGLVNFGNVVIQENIVVQIALAIGSSASATNLLGGLLNFSSIA